MSSIASWTPHQRIVVEKSPSYWDRDNIKLSGIVFYPHESVDTEERAFRGGQLHITYSLSLAKLPPGRYNCQISVVDPAAQKAAFWQALIMLVP